MADWRQLPCSRPDTVLGRGLTVAEFIDSSNCTSLSSTGSSKGDHATHNEADISQRRLKYGGQSQQAETRSSGVGHAQSTVKYVSLPSDMRLGRSLSTSGGSGSAAFVALALCAAMLALLGGLLLCRAGVRRSHDGGRIPRCREKRDLFVVYADDDEAWVTGTLLDVIFTRHPYYDVILQQHLQQSSCRETHVTQHKWNSYEQMVFGSVIDHSTV